MYAYNPHHQQTCCSRALAMHTYHHHLCYIHYVYVFTYVLNTLHVCIYIYIKNTLHVCIYIHYMYVFTYVCAQLTSSTTLLLESTSNAHVSSSFVLYTRCALYVRIYICMHITHIINKPAAQEHQHMHTHYMYIFTYEYVCT